MSTTTKKSTKDLVVNEILNQMEQGAVPWFQPWFNIGKQNLLSGHVYTGINKVLLADTPEQYFLTFKQCKSLGGHIKKGEKGRMIVFWKFFQKVDEAGQPIKGKTIPMLRRYTIFKIDQTEGISEEKINQLKEKHEAKLKENEFDITIDDFINETKAEIVNMSGTNAYYSHDRDHISMPELGQFINSDRYYTTLLHELTHWTGHSTRLNRDPGKYRRNREERGREELLAEIGSAMLSHEFNISDIEQSTTYILGWMTAIKNDNNIIFNASTKASEAVDYLKKLVA